MFGGDDMSGRVQDTCNVHTTQIKKKNAAEKIMCLADDDALVVTADIIIIIMYTQSPRSNRFIDRVANYIYA